MKSARIYNTTRQNVVCENCQIADGLWTRMRGLSGRKSLGENEGMLIVPCPSIHMFGMEFSLDVVFVTKEMVVTDIRESIHRRQMYVAKDKLKELVAASVIPNVASAPTASDTKAGKPHSALEMAVGSVARCNVQIGDKLEVQSNEPGT